MTSLPPARRSRVALGLTAAAAVGRFELQVCRRCGAVQYPPREACHRCLSSALDWRLQEGGGELLAETTLRHSHDEFFRERLPIRVGLVRLDAGPTAVVFLDDRVAVAPTRVKVGARLDRARQAVLVASADAQEGGLAQGGLLREMSCNPRGRRVFVTDASSAVGVTLVRALIDAGATVVWAGCSPSSANAGGLRSLVEWSNQVRPVDLDVTSDESVSAAADQIGSQVDILIDNAESRQAAPGARLARAFGPPMRANATGDASLAANAAAAGVPGLAVGAPMMAWVNLLSIYALSALPARKAFSASMAAAYTVAQSLRAQMALAGVRVINVFPGPIDDERNRELLPPKMAPASLARAVVKALEEGVEDVYPGEVAQEWYTRWHNSPNRLEREGATDR